MVNISFNLSKAYFYAARHEPTIRGGTITTMNGRKLCNRIQSRYCAFYCYRNWDNPEVPNLDHLRSFQDLRRESSRPPSWQAQTAPRECGIPRRVSSVRE
jgi:hypothetical protein